MMKKKNILVGVYIICWLFLVGYLVISNRLVALSISEKELMQEVDIKQYKSTRTPIYNIEVPMRYEGGMLEYAYCDGWAFCETEYDNSNKKISIIFRNVETNTAYACDYNVMWTRHDVYQAYKDKKKIYDGDTFVTCNFSTLLMRNGVYELLLYVEENEYDYGIISTGKYYMKTDKGMTNVDKYGNEFEFSSEGLVLAKEQTLVLENFIENGKWRFDEFEETEELLRLSGWAFYLPETNKTQEIYIALTYEDGTTKFYNTQLVKRPDVAKYFGDESYEYCGFSSNIMLEEGSNVKAISLIAKIDGKYYPIALNGKILEEEQKVETTQQSNNSENEEKKESVQKENVVNQDDAMIVLSQTEETGIAYIDNAKISQGVVVVKGWASYSAEKNEEQLVYVGLADSKGEITYYLAEKCYREDLATAVGERYVNCGFYKEIKPESIEEEYTISIVIQIGEEYHPIDIRNSRLTTK